jgi:hypothetical protein
MAELLVESLIPVVASLEKPILDAKRLREIIIKIMTRNLHRPPIEIFAIEKAYPTSVGGLLLRYGSGGWN